MTAAVRQFLAARSPRRYGERPTPLHRLDRFSAAVGREVWIKRDDLVSVGVGGNKIRKLAYLVADALASGADHLVTVGAAQSNHARCVAVVAAMEGVGCDLVLGGDPVSPAVGNLLLDHLLGATVHRPGTDDWSELEAISMAVADELRAAGKRPYAMPIGGSTPIGALGFVDAYLELYDQLGALGVAPTAIVHATSSGGTQAGLVVGRHLAGSSGGGPAARIVGIGVAKTGAHLAGEVAAIVEGCVNLVGGSPPPASDIVVVPGYLGPAYGEPTEGALAALRLLVRTEGIVVDPVYTAKALHAVVDLDGSMLGDGPLVFWHTGGLPAVFAPQYASHLLGRAQIDAENPRLLLDGEDIQVSRMPSP